MHLHGWVASHLWHQILKLHELLVPNPDEAKKKLKLLWISCGDNDDLITFSQRTHEYLQANNVPHIYYIDRGA